MWRGYNYSKECKKDLLLKRVSGFERLLLMRFLLERKEPGPHLFGGNGDGERHQIKTSFDFML
jgi:hypothetical protein